jgi:hypothetical protein
MTARHLRRCCVSCRVFKANSPARQWRAAPPDRPGTYNWKMRFGAASSVLACAAIALAVDAPTFRTTVSLVKADAYVYDRQTRVPILGLQRSDFLVYDEDQPRKILYFGNDFRNVDLVLLLDVSGNVREILPALASSAAEALSVLEKGDRAAVMAFTKKTVISTALTGDFGAVARGILALSDLQIGLDTDINQALWAAADYLHKSGGSARRAILILTDNMQETRVPDSLVDEQLAEAGAVLDGLLPRGLFAMPHVTHPGILGFARNTGGEVVEGNQPAARLAEMIRRIKFRYSIHFQPVESTSAKPRRIQIALTAEARKRYPHAAIRSRRIYFPLGTYKPKADLQPGQKIACARDPELT